MIIRFLILVILIALTGCAVSVGNEVNKNNTPSDTVEDGTNRTIPDFDEEFSIEESIEDVCNIHADCSGFCVAGACSETFCVHDDGYCSFTCTVDKDNDCLEYLPKNQTCQSYDDCKTPMIFYDSRCENNLCEWRFDDNAESELYECTRTSKQIFSEYAEEQGKFNARQVRNTIDQFYKDNCPQTCEADADCLQEGVMGGCLNLYAKSEYTNGILIEETEVHICMYDDVDRVLVEKLFGDVSTFNDTVDLMNKFNEIIDVESVDVVDYGLCEGRDACSEVTKRIVSTNNAVGNLGASSSDPIILTQICKCSELSCETNSDCYNDMNLEGCYNLYDESTQNGFAFCRYDDLNNDIYEKISSNLGYQEVSFLLNEEISCTANGGEFCDYNKDLECPTGTYNTPDQGLCCLSGCTSVLTCEERGGEYCEPNEACRGEEKMLNPGLCCIGECYFWE